MPLVYNFATKTRGTARLLAVAVIWLILGPRVRGAWGQQPEKSDPRFERRAAGLRAGDWQSLPYGEIYFQRGLAQSVALENSAGVWQRRQGDWRSYVIPLLTSLKIYPVSRPSQRFEPFIAGGIGFALGIDKESTHAIGGGGTSFLTGFGTKGAGGIEYHALRALTLQAGVHYLYMHFNDKLAGRHAFEGTGAEGGVSYRFTF